MAGTDHTAVAAAKALSPLLGWVTLILCMSLRQDLVPFVPRFRRVCVTYKQRRHGRWETWVWRVTLTGYLLACAGVFLDYWTQWTGNYNLLFQAGWIMTVPALVLTAAGR